MLAVIRVADAFTLPSADGQIESIVAILMERYTAEEIYDAAVDMPFNEELAERLRYTRGLTVTDFSSRIESSKGSKTDHNLIVTGHVHAIMVDDRSMTSRDDIAALVSKRMGVDVSADTVNEILK